jgi:class 3 adenylate cyclase/AAA+ ATPase superfamily predicted ATPase
MARNKRPPKSPPSGVITVMFTDIVNSTRLKGLMEGNTAARRDAKFRSDVKEPHDKMVLTCLEEAGGHKVKSTGDGYLFTFTDAEEAVLCALRIQDQLHANPINSPLGPLQVRIGLHTGIANPIGDDYIASAIDKAARVESRAEPGHVFVSRETHYLIIGKLRGVDFEQAGTFELRGLESEDLYRAFRPGVKTSGGDTPRDSHHDTSRAQLQNPYDFDTIATRKTFKGRGVESEELLDSIETGTHTAVFGLQRMGKTSLIEEGLREGIERRSDLSEVVRLVKIDMHKLGGDQVRYRDFLHAVIDAITEKVASVGLGREIQNLRARTDELVTPGRYQRGDRTEFFSVLSTLFRGFADATHRRIVLFIDEFSEVRKVIERNKTALQHNPLRTRGLLPHDLYIDVPFIHHLGSILKDQELKQKLTLIILVRPFISEYDEREGLQLLKLMKPITLYYLDEKAAKALITEPLEGQVAYEVGAGDYLYRLTAGHPYLLQFILKLIVDRVKRDGRRTITLEDVKSIEDRMISEGPAYDAQFAVLISDYSVDEITHPKEALLGKGLLALVARFGHEQQEGWVNEEQIFNELSKYKIPIEKTASLLSQLTRTKILEEMSENGKLRYRMSVPLLRKRFVRQNLYLKYFRQIAR